MASLTRKKHNSKPENVLSGGQGKDRRGKKTVYLDLLTQFIPKISKVTSVEKVLFLITQSRIVVGFFLTGVYIDIQTHA